MSKYTMELRTICETVGRDEVESWFKAYDLADYLSAREIAVIEHDGVWNKDRLAKKIVDNYYMREIGFETVGLFKHYVNIWMEKVMEEKLPLIYSKAIDYDPLVNVDYTESFKAKNISNGISQSDSRSSGLGVNSDTPQGQVNKTDILNGKYASSTGASESSANDKSTTDSKGMQEYVKNIKGNSGVSATAQAMVKQYRQNIVAIDREIIDELNVLFMCVY